MCARVTLLLKKARSGLGIPVSDVLSSLGAHVRHGAVSLAVDRLRLNHPLGVDLASVQTFDRSDRIVQVKSYQGHDGSMGTVDDIRRAFEAYPEAGRASPSRPATALAPPRSTSCAPTSTGQSP